MNWNCLRINRIKYNELLYSFQNIHQGYPNETLIRFLKARDGNVSKAHKMVQNLFWLEIWKKKKKKPIAIDVYLCIFIVSGSVQLSQLLDCLNWRIQNEIDNILAVSVQHPIFCLYLVHDMFSSTWLISGQTRLCSLLYETE